MKAAAQNILDTLGIPGRIKNPESKSNYIELGFDQVEGVNINAEVVVFLDSRKCRVDINFSLPAEGVPAATFMDHCAAAENIPKNHSNEYCFGPTYKTYDEERRGKNTFALSPWSNYYFYVRSEGYPTSEIQTATDNAVALARLFIKHLYEYRSLRFWKTDDPEVIEKARTVIANAELYETDTDRESGAHYMRDKNSFFKGWFYPMKNQGKGRFDDFLFGPHFAANKMGNKGTFEYAVALLLLESPEFIAKARKGCRIREEVFTRKW